MLDAWLDGELDASTSGEIANHLSNCPDCLALKHDRDQLRQRVQRDAPRFVASAALRQVVARGAADRTARLGGLRPSWWQAFGLAACVGVFSATATWLLIHMSANETQAQPLREQIVARHVASLTRASPIDVASSDRHVIKPWFQGKVDFAPVVRDLSAQGFILRGARLDHIGNQQAVAVVYQVRQHPINLFVWHDASDKMAPLELASARGFSIATWRGGGLAYAAISDVESRELEQFARQLQAPP